LSENPPACNLASDREPPQGLSNVAWKDAGEYRVTVLVTFQPSGRHVEVPEHTTLLDAARLIVFPDHESLGAPCGGKGQCGRCKIRVANGTVSHPTDREKTLLTSGELEEGVRLACQTEALGPAIVEIPPESFTGKQSLQVEGLDFEIEVEPATQRYVVSTKVPTLSQPLSSWQQIVRALEERYEIPSPTIGLELLRAEIPRDREDHETTVTVRDREVINRWDVFPAPRSLGLAVNLGTTKVAGFLVDLETGATVASAASMNPQIAYGEDVMSRLNYGEASEGQREQMQSLAVACVNDLLASLLSKSAMESLQVEHAVIVGNSAMHHLILKLPARNLAASPYAPTAQFPIEVKGREIGLHLAPGATVYFAPLIAGFVGGDHVAMIMASRIFDQKGVTLGLDIGTNTEIVLAKDGEMTCCSCASGPAFEGGHLRHGMRAVEGAISKVTWAIPGKRLHYETIGNSRPLGFCGSGVIDAIAELVRAGIISHVGLLDRSHRDIRIEANGKSPEYVVVPRTDSGTGSDITLTQHDIVAIQLAKAAIGTGTRLLLSHHSLTEQDIDRVVIAGAFGSGINVESAISIGLLPNLPVERFSNVGNAAGTGARLFLMSMSARKAAESMARQVAYLELAVHSKFAATFAESLEFTKSFTPDTEAHET